MTDQDRMPLIISVAPNGARRTTADRPAIPLTAAELAASALLADGDTGR